MTAVPAKKKRLCSRLTKHGLPCRAWAMRGSDPPVCSVHAGATVSPGAPRGNTYALKHGYYSKAVRDRCADNEIDQIQSPSLHGELVAGRIVLADLLAYYLRPDLQPEQKMTAVPLINSLLRTNTYIAGRVNKLDVDWDEILDNLKEEWGEI
jgi:hypothetical protein